MNTPETARFFLRLFSDLVILRSITTFLVANIWLCQRLNRRVRFEFSTDGAVALVQWQQLFLVLNIHFCVFRKQSRFQLGTVSCGCRCFDAESHQEWNHMSHQNLTACAARSFALYTPFEISFLLSQEGSQVWGLRFLYEACSSPPGHALTSHELPAMLCFSQENRHCWYHVRCELILVGIKKSLFWGGARVGKTLWFPGWRWETFWGPNPFPWRKFRGRLGEGTKSDSGPQGEFTWFSQNCQV